jgi:hypothetical protein
MTDIQYFIDTLPEKPNRNIIETQLENNLDSLNSITTDEAIILWSEHDALHYLSGQPFSEEGEQCVAKLEKVFNRGWLSFGWKYNTYTPKDCEYRHITQELIEETAELIRGFYD